MIVLPLPEEAAARAISSGFRPGLGASPLTAGRAPDNLSFVTGSEAAMRVLVYAMAASWLVLAPALAKEEGRTGRGADADGHAAASAERVAQAERDRGSRAAILMVSALVEQLVEEGALSKDGAARVLDRATALSATRLRDLESGQQN